MKKNKNSNFVYSTNPSFEFADDEEDFAADTSAGENILYVSIDRKKRSGKAVTLIEGFKGSPEKFKELGKFLKGKCGVGGTAKDGDILIQGQFKDKIADLLVAKGYQVKKKGGN